MSNPFLYHYSQFDHPLLPGGNNDTGDTGKIEDISGKDPEKNYTKADKSVARAAQLSVTFNNTDISAVVNKYLMTFNFTDNEEDEADDLQIKLEDRNGTWLQKWLQDFIEDSAGPHVTGSKLKRTRITAKIKMPISGKLYTRNVGLFELDDVKASGPPSVVVIKGTSLAYNGIRSTKNDKNWTSTTLKKIAQKIAHSHGMGLLWDCKEDKKFTRVEQADQTDIAFLKKICQDAGCSLKITGNKIVIYDQSKYEELQSIATITFGDKSYIKWNLSTGEGETEYDMCTVKYTNPKTGQAITGTYKTEEWKKKEKDQADKDAEDRDKPEVLVIRNEKVSSVAEANALAEKRLKLANKFERKVTLTLPGNPNYCAGTTMQLIKFGYWSGKYLVSKSKHDITSSGYTTTLTLRRVDKVKTSDSTGGDDNPFPTDFLGGNIDIQEILRMLQRQFS